MIQDHPIAAVRVFVSDLTRARAFYNDRLKLPLKIDGEPYGFLIFQMKGFDLIIEIISPDELENEGHLIGQFISCSWKTADIQADYEKLKEAGIKATEPKKQDWGGTLMHFYDPEGNGFTLVED